MEVLSTVKQEEWEKHVGRQFRRWKIRSLVLLTLNWGFPGGSVVKNPPVNAGDTGDVGLIPGS